MSAACRTAQHEDCPFGPDRLPLCHCPHHSTGKEPPSKVTYRCKCGYETTSLTGDGIFHLAIDHGHTVHKAHLLKKSIFQPITTHP